MNTHALRLGIALSALASIGSAQTYLTEDFAGGIPTDWPVGISVPSVTSWRTLLGGDCTNPTDAAGFTGNGCQTGARSFPSSSFLATPSFTLSGSPPYFVEFDSTFAMDLGFDSVSLSVVDDLGFPSPILDGSTLSNTGVTERVVAQIPDAFAGASISLQFYGEATAAGAGQLGWIIDDVLVRSGDTGIASCFGDSSGNNCPCGNFVAVGTHTGCLNSSGVGARLVGSGTPSVAADTLAFDVEGAPPAGFGILASGDNLLPAAFPGIGISSFDGLRCVGGNLQRHGGRTFDAAGTNTTPWGFGGAPAGGLIAQGGFAAGQTRHWQVFLRDLPGAICMTGRNYSNAVSTTFAP